MNNHVYRCHNEMPVVAVVSLLLLFTIVAMFIGYMTYFNIAIQPSHNWVFGSFVLSLLFGFVSGFGFNEPGPKWLVLFYFMFIWVFWMSAGYYAFLN